MSGLPKQTFPLIAFIAITAVFVVLVFFPAALNTRIIGFLGEYTGGNIVVLEVFPGSPARKGGLSEGDVVTTQADRPISDWHRMYAGDMNAYVDARIALAAGPSDYVILRGQQRIDLTFEARELRFRELLVHFGVRVFLILCVLGLAVFVILSRSREPGALLSCACFCFAVLWFASDQPYWPLFSSPLERGVPVPQTYFVDLVELFSLQLVMGTLLHIALIFPGDREILRRYRRLPALGYLLAIVVPFAVLAFGDGNLADRIAATYQPRVYVNSVLIVLITLLMADSYRKSTSPSVRERSRWIVAAMIVVAVCHLVFWNIPTMVIGHALIANYNWLLLTVLLLPLSLAMAFTNHQLFGVRGVIRRRIRLLESKLGRQQHLLVRRDENIRKMQDEIRHLRRELGEYEHKEDPGARGPGDGLDRLEQRYPQLREVRQQGLVSISPLWIPVFEQAAIASRGTGPVLVVGESGTGKTDIAGLVHSMSDRRDAVYRQISCSQFEHADPAFALGRLFGIGTGHGLQNVPREGRKGLLEECDGGSLLLDDFDRLPLNVQDLFLYPLEEKPFEPGIGSGPSRSVSVKFIFATNVEPETLVEQGRFRHDVLARLVTRIDIPPLRERREDIPLLVEQSLTGLAEEIGHEISLVSPRAMNLLCRNRYEHGNVRELRAELQTAISKAALENDPTLRAGYLSQRIRGPVGGGPDRDAPRENPSAPGSVLEQSAELEVLRRHGFQIASAEEELGYSHKSKTLSNHLRGMCMQAMMEADWDPELASAALAGDGGASVANKLRSKMNRYLSRVEENVHSGTEKRLFNNLPAAYHDALNAAIARLEP